MTYEAPKRFTAVNDVTGALIKSKSDNQDAYSTGYDILKSGNVSKEQPETKFPVTVQISKEDLGTINNISLEMKISKEKVIEWIVFLYLHGN